MSDNLKPCPFCGSHDVSMSHPLSDDQYVWCSECGAKVSCFDIEGATGTWNTRVPSPDVAALRATLEKLVYEAEFYGNDGDRSLDAAIAAARAAMEGAR